jgi:drug/metabolite transporter (DMT)-like permease
MYWFFLSLLCAFSLATADAATKRYLADYAATELSMVRFGFAALFLAPLLFIIPFPDIPAPFWVWVGALVPLEILAMLLYMRAIRDSPLSLTLPYLAFTPVFTIVPGILLLGEEVSVLGFCGILLVVAGAYLLNVEHVLADPRRAILAPFRAIVRERGSRLMLAVALIYSMTSVMGKGALQYVPALFFGAFYFTLLGVVTLILFSLHQPGVVTVMWRRIGPHLFIGMMMTLMVVTHFFAIEQVEVSYMIAVKRISLLFGIGYGVLLFGEKQLFQHLTAGMLMVAGVLLIAL